MLSSPNIYCVVPYVIPAEAGIQYFKAVLKNLDFKDFLAWIPAFAGMTSVLKLTLMYLHGNDTNNLTPKYRFFKQINVNMKDIYVDF